MCHKALNHNYLPLNNDAILNELRHKKGGRIQQEIKKKYGIYPGFAAQWTDLGCVAYSCRKAYTANLDIPQSLTTKNVFKNSHTSYSNQRYLMCSSWNESRGLFRLIF